MIEKLTDEQLHEWVLEHARAPWIVEPRKHPQNVYGERLLSLLTELVFLRSAAPQPQAIPSQEERVARVIYEAYGFAYDGRTINGAGLPYGEWERANIAARATIAARASPSLEALKDAISAHSSPTYDRGDAHGQRGQRGYIVWENQIPFIAAALSPSQEGGMREALEQIAELGRPYPEGWGDYEKENSTEAAIARQEACGDIARAALASPSQEDKIDAANAAERLAECAAVDRGPFSKFACPRVVERDDLLAVLACHSHGRAMRETLEAARMAIQGQGPMPPDEEQALLAKIDATLAHDGGREGA